MLILARKANPVHDYTILIEFLLQLLQIPR